MAQMIAINFSSVGRSKALGSRNGGFNSLGVTVRAPYDQDYSIELEYIKGTNSLVKNYQNR